MEVDWNKFSIEDFEAAKKFAHDFYCTIGRIKCPALDNQYVSFSGKGIRHILYKPSRIQAEIIERLSYLRYAESILIDPYAKIEYRQKNEKEYLKKRGQFKLYEVESQYWSFKKEVEQSLIIKVVIRQVGQGNKYFYSIMKYNGQ